MQSLSKLQVYISEIVRWNEKVLLLRFNAYLLCSSLTVLSLVLKYIPVGVAYAVWSGFGILLIASVGIVSFHEKLNVAQMIFIGMILIGVIGLNLTTRWH